LSKEKKFLPFKKKVRLFENMGVNIEPLRRGVTGEEKKLGRGGSV